MHALITAIPLIIQALGMCISPGYPLCNICLWLDAFLCPFLPVIYDIQDPVEVLTLKYLLHLFLFEFCDSRESKSLTDLLSISGNLISLRGSL